MNNKFKTLIVVFLVLLVVVSSSLNQIKNNSKVTSEKSLFTTSTTLASGTFSDVWYNHNTTFYYEISQSASNEQTTVSDTGYPPPSYPSYPSAGGTVSWNITLNGNVLTSGTTGAVDITHSQYYTHFKGTRDGVTLYETLAYSVTSWKYIVDYIENFQSYGSTSGTTYTWVINLDGSSETGTIDIFSDTISIPSSASTFIGKTLTFQADITNFPEIGYDWYVNGVSQNVNSSVFSFTFNNKGVYDVHYIAMNQTGYAIFSPNEAVTVSAYTLNFTETGLPSGDEWFVNLTNGETNSTTGTYVDFFVENGTYTYTVADVNKQYGISPVTGNAVVSGQNVVKDITFSTTTFSTTFTESGLPSGTIWYVNITGQAVINSGQITSTSYTVGLVNGQYSYKTSTADKNYYTTQLTGNFIVNGSTVSISITYSPYLYQVIFAETNLPLGDTWWINISTTSKSAQVTSTTIASTIDYQLQNGTYTYYPASLNKTYYALSGTFTINGAGTTITVPFAIKTYSVTFSETGLPSSTIWYVNVTGYPSSGKITQTSYASNFQNGSYTFSVATVDKQFSPSYTNTFTVNGANLVINIKFVPYNYSVTFLELGLPSGTSWSIDFNNVTESSTTTTIVFEIINGTYSYAVQLVKGYSASPSSGDVTVNGGAQSVSIAFTANPVEKFTVEFSEIGLPRFHAWSVTFNGTTETSTGSTIEYSVPNGTYSFNVSVISGYSSSPHTGSLTVNGANINQVITFTVITYSVTFDETGLPSGTEWYVNITSTSTSSLSSTTSSAATNLVNGTYNYNIATVNKVYHANGGSFTVDGSAVTIDVTFALVTYQIKFNETGLPTGNVWYVNITGESSLSATSPSGMTISLDNGSYSYNVSTSFKNYAPTSYTGTFTVNGQLNISIIFEPVLFVVTFSETGLLSGTTWYANTTSSHSTSTTSLSFSVTNGTYPYTIATQNKTYHPLVDSGNFIVSGAPVSESVQFVLQEYTVEFNMTGLPTGDIWYINISNIFSSGPLTNTTIYTNLTNGTYNYNIGSVNKIYYNPGGSFVVDGSNVTVPIIFSLYLYNIVFNAEHLPSSMIWYLNISGEMTNNSGPITSLKYTIGLVNGSYNYIVGTNSTAYGANGGSFNVSGSSKTLDINFIYGYAILFIEQGLQTTAEWFLNITGVGSFIIRNSSSMTLILKPGYYTYSYSSNNNNTKPSIDPGFLTVTNSSLTVYLVFLSIQSQVNLLPYIIGIAVIIIVVLVAIMIIKEFS